MNNYVEITFTQAFFIGWCIYTIAKFVNKKEKEEKERDRARRRKFAEVRKRLREIESN